MSKMVLTKINTDKYYVNKHIESKHYNDYTGKIIGLDELLIELSGYANNGIIDLNNILIIKDKFGNIISLDELYGLLDSLILINKLINKTLVNFMNEYNY